MDALRISLFGTIRVLPPNHSDEVPLTRSAQSLLAFLLLHRNRKHSREVLAGLFWGDHSDDQARSCLSTALWRLRRVLESNGVPRGAYVVTTAQGEVGFNQSCSYWLDVAVFEQRVRACITQPAETMNESDAQALEEAIDLYTGELLEGFFDEWALEERERLRCLFLSGLAYLLQYYKRRNDYEKGLSCGRRILQTDPLREEIHREMMRLYMASGQRAQAARQYDLCREALASELGIPPMEETQRLHDQIRSAVAIDDVSFKQKGDIPSLDQALHQLHLSMRNFEAARTQLQRAIHLVKRLSSTSHPEAHSADEIPRAQSKD